MIWFVLYLRHGIIRLVKLKFFLFGFSGEEKRSRSIIVCQHPFLKIQGLFCHDNLDLVHGVKRSVKRSVKQSVKRSVKRSFKRPVKRSDKRSVKRSV